jgi:hypothetical protein
MAPASLDYRCRGCLDPGVQTCVQTLGDVQVHATSSGAISEASSLAAFDSEADPPADPDSRTAPTAADRGDTSRSARPTTEITPADDVGQPASTSGKMRQLTPGLADEGVPWWPFAARQVWDGVSFIGDDVLSAPTLPSQRLLMPAVDCNVLAHPGRTSAEPPLSWLPADMTSSEAWRQWLAANQGMLAACGAGATALAVVGAFMLSSGRRR